MTTDKDLERARALIAAWHMRGDVVLLGTDGCLAQALATTRRRTLLEVLEMAEGLETAGAIRNLIRDWLKET